MITRRKLLEAAGTGATLMGGLALPQASGFAQDKTPLNPDKTPLNATPALPEGTRSEVVLDALPGKKPLIKLSYQPPNYETPIEYFHTAITPNDAFFVRYHLSNIPEVDAQTWTLSVGGDGANDQIDVSLADLKAMPAVEIVAVNQCSGNRRGLFQPHVAGVQWGYGAMGCARWKGVRLKDLLDKVGLKKEAIEIVFGGADSPALDKTPGFIKSIPIWKAIEESTLVAYEMNGQPLPHFNGFPARIVVPGWTATYWMKHVTAIKAVTKPESGFWMSTAYRIPLGKFPVVSHFASQEGAANTPITEILVNSLITSHPDGAVLKPGDTTVAGVAWDGGYGIRAVELSTDDGKRWVAANLGEDLGRFAFRTFKFRLLAQQRGKHTVLARATNKIGQTQTNELIANPAGYHNNVMHCITLTVA
jgi:DMSO/TMAO reductase YedYZ molybdopterin-dependent catalytic subunit